MESKTFSATVQRKARLDNPIRICYNLEAREPEDPSDGEREEHIKN